MVQSGNRLFRTDEAILSCDWVSSESIICVYALINREFFWVNRSYELTGNGYNKMSKDNLEQETPKPNALIHGTFSKARTLLGEHLEKGNIIRQAEMRMTSTPERMPEVERKREGAHGLIIDKITFQTAFFGALSDAQTIRRNKGRGRGRGSRYPGGSAEGQVQMIIFSTSKVKQWLIGWTDSRIGTKVCRLESTAKAKASRSSLVPRGSPTEPRRIRDGPDEARLGT